MLVVKKIPLSTDFDKVKSLFLSVFSKEPWNDKWDDLDQLDMYIKELTTAFNSLSYGLYDDEKLLGIALGRKMHFYEGIQFRIDEFCVLTSLQGKGLGSFFMETIAKECRKDNIKYLILCTDRTYPAYKFYKKQGFVESEKNVMFSKEL